MPCVGTLTFSFAEQAVYRTPLCEYWMRKLWKWFHNRCLKSNLFFSIGSRMCTCTCVSNVIGLIIRSGRKMIFQTTTIIIILCARTWERKKKFNCLTVVTERLRVFVPNTHAWVQPKQKYLADNDDYCAALNMEYPYYAFRSRRIDNVYMPHSLWS